MIRRAATVHRWSCFAFVAAALLAYAVAAAPPDQQGSGYIALHVLLTSLMLSTWWSGDGLGAARVTLAAGIAARLCLAAVPAFTTHDVDRYLWDGAVAAAGLDPYLLAPDAQEVADLRGLWPTPAEHAAYATVYPPVALSLFALCAKAGPQWAPWLWKLLVTGASLATLGVVFAVLRRRQLLRHLPLVALSPLLLLESGVGAHVDAFSTLCVALAWLCLDRRRTWLAGAALGLGAALKLLPALALLPLAAWLGRRGAGLVAAAAIVLGASYGVAHAVGWQGVGSLPLFIERWRFGAPLFAVLHGWLPGAVVLASLAAVAVLIVASAVRLARRDPVHGVQLALAAPLLAGPVAFPWYAMALIPGLALRPRWWLLAFVSALPLSYEVLNRFNAEGVWAPATWPLAAIVLAVGLGAVIDAAAGRAIPSDSSHRRDTPRIEPWPR